MITLLPTSDLSLPYSVRSYIDSCAYEYTKQDFPCSTFRNALERNFWGRTIDET